MGIARGVAISHDANLLVENDINITDWAQHLLQRMDLVKRKWIIKVKVLPSDFVKLKKTIFIRCPYSCTHGRNT